MAATTTTGPSVKLAEYSDSRNLRDFLKGQIWGTVSPVTPDNIEKAHVGNRTIIITGANTGLGLKAAKQFAKLACVSRLVLACRDLRKAEAAKEEVLTTLTENKRTTTDIQCWKLDMASRASLVAFAERANSELDRIDAIVLNAGVDFGSQYVKTASEEGPFEMTVMVNVIGTMMLATLMVPILRKKAVPELRPRITIVGSAVQFFIKYQILVDAANNRSGESVLEFLSNEARWKDKITDDRYYLSKGILQMLVQQLTANMSKENGSSGNPPVIVNCVAPGYCKTDLFRTSGTAMRKMSLRLIGREAEIGARTLVVGAVGQTGGVESHGMYMSEGEVKGSGSKWFKTEQGREIGRRIWGEVCDLIKAAAGLNAIQL